MNRQLILNRGTKSLYNRSLVRSADRDSQDKNLVGLLDRIAKTAGLRDSILTHVYP